MGTVSRDYTFSAGAVIVAAQFNTNENTLYNLVNGNIDKDNIKTTAGILDTQLAQITTAQKVNTSALVTSSQAAGDVMYNDGTNWVRLAKDAGKYLKSGASAVSWETVSVAAVAGMVVQVVRTSYVTYASLGTTAIVVDDTPVTWAEGNEIAGLETSITPTSASNILEVSVVAHLSANTSGVEEQALSMFIDPTGTDASKSTSIIMADSATLPVAIPMLYTQVAGSASAMTFKFRTGNADGDLTVINGKAATTAGRLFGGTLVSTVVIREIKV